MPSKLRRPMSDGAITRWHTFFCEWRSLNVASQGLEILHNLAGNHILDDQRLKWAKEVHIACEYAKALGLKAIRVVRTDPPDFEAMSETGRVDRCEAVEVVRPGRRRDQELRLERRKPPVPIHDPEEGWLSVAEALDAVDAQIGKKADKSYPERFVLVAYINVGFLRGDEAAFHQGLKDRQVNGHANFAAVHFV